MALLVADLGEAERHFRRGAEGHFPDVPSPASGRGGLFCFWAQIPLQLAISPPCWTCEVRTSGSSGHRRLDGAYVRNADHGRRSLPRPR
jgi:hypothetical protein